MAKPFTLPPNGVDMDASYMKAEFERNGWTPEEVREYWRAEGVCPEMIDNLMKTIFGDEKSE